jgi:hypothetical protein
MFDNEGLVAIYTVTNTAPAGDMPNEVLTAYGSRYYSVRTIGVTRLYAALGADQAIDGLITVHKDRLPNTGELVFVLDDEQYRAAARQYSGDDTIVTLERLEKFYEFSTSQNQGSP